MLTYLFMSLGILFVMYLILSVYPAVIVHSLSDSRAPDSVRDFIRMTYLLYVFKCKKLRIPY